MTDSLSLLAVFAHPDDEGLSGGVLAKYANEGVRVALACATRGEAGEISDPALATPETLGQVREAELRDACRILGVKELYFLGYRDSGMAGTTENNHPDALVQADPQAVVGKIVRLIRVVRPKVVITFEPGGGYGHPDHVAVSKYTTEAFRIAGDASAYPEHSAEGLQPFAPDKLYYPVFPPEMLRKFREVAQKLRMDLSRFGSPEEFERRAALANQVTTIVDVSAYTELMVRALKCHRTQLGANSPMRLIPDFLFREFLKHQHFILAAGENGAGDGKETDLFAGKPAIRYQVSGISHQPASLTTDA